MKEFKFGKKKHLALMQEIMQNTISIAQLEIAYDLILEAIKRQLKKGNVINIPNFGMFYLVEQLGYKSIFAKSKVVVHKLKFNITAKIANMFSED